MPSYAVLNLFSIFDVILGRPAFIFGHFDVIVGRVDAFLNRVDIIVGRFDVIFGRFHGSFSVRFSQMGRGARGCGAPGEDNGKTAAEGKYNR